MIDIKMSEETKVEETKVEETKVEETKVEVELVEAITPDDINIPDTLVKYRNVIEKLENSYSTLAKECIDGFDGSDFMLLVNALTKTIAELRNVIDDLKEVDADDRITIYNLLISAVIIQSVEKSNLDEHTKEQVVNAFQSGGMVLNLIELIRASFKKMLKKMDTNNDNYVTKEEFKQYHIEKNKDSCFGEECNEKTAECLANCCFPLLACGKKKIKINKNK